MEKEKPMKGNELVKTTSEGGGDRRKQRSSQSVSQPASLNSQPETANGGDRSYLIHEGKKNIVASDLRLKQIFRLMGGLQGIVAVCSRSAFTLRCVSGGAYANCVYSPSPRSGSDTLESSQKAPQPSMGWTRGRCPTCGRCRTPRRRNYAPSRQASLASKNTKCSIQGSDPMSVKRFESPSLASAGS